MECLSPNASLFLCKPTECTNFCFQSPLIGIYAGLIIRYSLIFAHKQRKNAVCKQSMAACVANKTKKVWPPSSYNDPVCGLKDCSTQALMKGKTKLVSFFSLNAGHTYSYYSHYQ